VSGTQGWYLARFLLWLIVSDAAFAVFEPQAVTVHLKDVHVVGEAIEQCAGQALGAEDAGPLIEVGKF
jgi:hypothetical protein